MSPLYKSLTDVSQDLFDKVMNVNLRGPFRLSALFGQQMFNDGNGSIINVSSIAAAQPSPHEVPYGAAKAGLHSLTKSFSRAYAPHVRVNCIVPGPFLTDISDAWSDATHESLKHLPLGRGGQPDEVVGAALYFASEASSFTTGSVLKIDGGLSHQRRNQRLLGRLTNRLASERKPSSSRMTTSINWNIVTGYER